jgi:hypothetical protein
VKLLKVIDARLKALGIGLAAFFRPKKRMIWVEPQDFSVLRQWEGALAAM